MISDQWKPHLPKRFYETVTVGQSDEGHGILLDGRAVRTPLKNALIVPTPGLASAIADEWSAQEEHIVPASMPVSKLAHTSIDHAAPKSAAIVDEFVSYAGSDLVCYRADTPEKLAARQCEHWDPVLAWAESELNAALVVTVGVIHQAQPEAALDALRAHVAPLDPFRLTGLQTLTALTGSALLALALAEDQMKPDAVWAAANVDEDWQIELWGHDAEAERQRASRRVEFTAAAQFLRFL